MLGLFDGVRPPDSFQDRAVRQNAVMILREQREEVELLGREPDFGVLPDARGVGRSRW